MSIIRLSYCVKINGPKFKYPQLMLLVRYALILTLVGWKQNWLVHAHHDLSLRRPHIVTRPHGSCMMCGWNILSDWNIHLVKGTACIPWSRLFQYYIHIYCLFTYLFAVWQSNFPLHSLSFLLCISGRVYTLRDVHYLLKWTEA